MIVLYFYCALTILGSSAYALVVNRTIEGYPAGFLSDCPGSMKPAVISKRNLKFIQIYISGAKAPLGQRNMYTYNNMAGMAKDPTMDYSKRTLFFIGGYFDTIKNPFGKMLEFYYRRRGYNVWILEYLKFSLYDYPVVVRAAMAVSERVTEMLVYVTATTKFDPKKLDILGLSLGGQIISFIAKSYKNKTGVKISRLTGLDPAGPCFRNRGPESRLDASDADFVDVIQTNIDVLGMAAPIGHVNFYVNGGEYQPGDYYWNLCGTFNSHIRSYTLWVATLDSPPNSFIAMKCDSVQDARDHRCYDRKPIETNVVGPDVDRNKTGIFYLATSNLFPYYLGKGGLKKNNNYVMKQLRNMNTIDVLNL